MSLLSRNIMDAITTSLQTTSRGEGARQAIAVLVEAVDPPDTPEIGYLEMQTREDLVGQPHRAFLVTIDGSERTGVSPRVAYSGFLTLYLQADETLPANDSRRVVEGEQIARVIRDQEYWPTGVSNVFVDGIAYDVDEEAGASLVQLSLRIETQE